MKDLVLVTGSEGLVGSRFVELSSLRNSLHTPKEIELNILKREELKAIFSSYSFEAVVHFAAFTDVTKAESERGNKDGVCWQVNVEGTRNLVEAVKNQKGKIHFIHISTDMVFSGGSWDPGPYKEDHPIEKDYRKLTWYGASKAEAEHLVQELLGEAATILRINYPVRAHFDGKLDYIRKHIKLFDEGNLYPLFTDQHLSISFIDEVVKVIDIILMKGKRGIFHASSKDTTTPYELINYVLEKVRGFKNAVEKTTLREFLKKTNTPSYRYPKFGGLDVRKTQDVLDFEFSSVFQIVDCLVKQGLGR